MKIKNLFRAGAMAVAVAALGMSVGGCGNGAAKAESLQAAASLADSVAGEGWEVKADGNNLVATCTLTDSLLNPEAIGDALFDIYAAQQLKTYSAADINAVANALHENEGKLDITLVSPALGSSRAIELTAKRLVTLQKSKNSQLNASAAREQVVKLAETMVPAPAAHKDAVRVEAAVVKSFLEYNIIFADAKAYAGNDQSLLTVRYFEPLKAQYRAMGDMAPSVVEMLQGMGIDGVRIQYSAENSDKTIKQAFPWREISK